MESRVRRILINAVLWLALVVFVILGVVNLSEIQKYSMVSLRYDSPISASAAYQARVYAAGQSRDDVFWPTFWNETKVSVSSEYKTAGATGIFFSGDAALVWPASYLKGNAPGVTDSTGCAISSALAWDLMGGLDLVGMTIEVDGEARIIRGVFEGGDPLLILSVGDEGISGSFTSVELSGGPSSPAREDVERFAVAAGLGPPDNILVGTPNYVASFLAALPIIIIVIYFLILCVWNLRKRPFALWGSFLAALILIAAFMPYFLNKMPDRFIPTRWSDFSFWGSLVKQIGSDIREYLVLTPRSRDISYTIQLLKQAGIAFFSVCLSLSVCFRSKTQFELPESSVL